MLFRSLLFLIQWNFEHVDLSYSPSDALDFRQALRARFGEGPECDLTSLSQLIRSTRPGLNVRVYVLLFLRRQHSPSLTYPTALTGARLLAWARLEVYFVAL